MKLLIALIFVFSSTLSASQSESPSNGPILDDQTPAAVEYYLSYLFADQCGIELKYEDLRVILFKEVYSGEEGSDTYSFARDYKVYYEGKKIGYAYATGNGQEDDEENTDWDFAINCPGA